MNLFKKSKGFTLVEVLIALVILAISLLALAALMATTVRNNSFGGHITEASTIAQDKLEEIRAMRWEDIQSGPPGPDPDKKPGSTGVDYIRNWNVVQNGNIKTVTITVDWTDRINHSIRLLSVISN